MTIPITIIDKYVLVLLEYIHLFDSSDIIRSVCNPTVVYKIGIHAISHIYKLSYCITKNAETAGCYTQKGMYCYLEYVEQMNRTHSLHNLNNTDAVLFVYDKTLSELYLTNGKLNHNHQEQNMFSNIVSLNDSIVCEYDYKPILDNLSSITQTILWVDNVNITHLEQLNLAHEYLPKFMSIYTNLPVQPVKTNTILSVIQDKIQMTYDEYVDLLETVYKIQKKTAKQSPSSQTGTHEICLIISVFFSGKTLGEIATSEYAKQTGWKSITDFTKWAFA
jgi:hypothetical protein